MVVSVEHFVKCINDIKAQLEKDDKLSELIMCPDTNGWISTSPELIDDIIDLLRDSVDDDGDFISWFLWEMDENTNYVWEEVDGVSYKFVISDAEDLYYLITNQHDHIKEQCEEEPPSDKYIFSENGTFEKTVYGNNKCQHGHRDKTLYDIFMETFGQYTESDN